MLIEGGKLLEENMKKNKYTLDSLNEMLREKEIFNISEVEYALLENSGKLSVLKKKQYRNLTLHDLHSPASNPSAFPIELIMDGMLIKEHLRDANITLHALEKAISAKGHHLKDVFYAVRGSDNKLYFDFYQDKLDKPLDKE
ncbi:DUF421 domain-containing protein [Paenibacillus sp. R14(2021)]|uniref:DUF421 domain-containing protein n=1 Tax=Paenibacillus sp. R14(2021) TaxID=2859228 RepID=UPI00280B4446|nr:DUF421 domain-containing protein [Paenibacillus sp. R14(2021)]